MLVTEKLDWGGKENVKVKKLPKLTQSSAGHRGDKSMPHVRFDNSEYTPSNADLCGAKMTYKHLA
jgi:hypothetical protein